jgi:hypothetical protein
VTGPNEAPRELDPADVRAAIADLGRLRDLLQRAGRGEPELGQMRAALADFWRDHGNVLTGAARAVGEQLRLTALQALYRWRAQLDQQLHQAPKR